MCDNTHFTSFHGQSYHPSWGCVSSTCTHKWGKEGSGRGNVRFEEPVSFLLYDRGNKEKDRLTSWPDFVLFSCLFRPLYSTGLLRKSLLIFRRGSSESQGPPGTEEESCVSKFSVSTAPLTGNDPGLERNSRGLYNRMYSLESLYSSTNTVTVKSFLSYRPVSDLLKEFQSR